MKRRRATNLTSESNRIVITGAFVILVGLVLFFSANKQGVNPLPPAAEYVSYNRSLLLSVEWSAKPGKFGLLLPPDGEIIGPRTFTLDDAGNIYILDTVKRNVKVFSPEGKFQASIGKNLLGYAIACYDGFIYVLDGGVLRKYTTAGSPAGGYEISDRINLHEGYGQWMRVTKDGAIYVKAGRKSYRIFTDLNESILPENVQADSERMGTPNRNGTRWYRFDRKAPDRQILTVSDNAGKVLQEIPLETDRIFGANYYLDEDRSGNILLEVQILDDEGSALLEVWRFDRFGRRTCAIGLPNRYYTGVFKKLFVDEDGVLYQMRTEPEGVFIDKWARVTR